MLESEKDLVVALEAQCPELAMSGKNIFSVVVVLPVALQVTDMTVLFARQTNTDTKQKVDYQTPTFGPEVA